VYTNIQPVVKTVVQPRLTTGWTNSGCSFNTVRDGCKTGCTTGFWFDNRLYRVNGVSLTMNMSFVANTKQGAQLSQRNRAMLNQCEMKIVNQFHRLSGRGLFAMLTKSGPYSNIAIVILCGFCATGGVARICYKVGHKTLWNFLSHKTGREIIHWNWTRFGSYAAATELPQLCYRRIGPYKMLQNGEAIIGNRTKSLPVPDCQWISVTLTY